MSWLSHVQIDCRPAAKLPTFCYAGAAMKTVKAQPMPLQLLVVSVPATGIALRTALMPVSMSPAAENNQSAGDRH